MSGEHEVHCTHDGLPEHVWDPAGSCPDALPPGIWSVHPATPVVQTHRCNHDAGVCGNPDHRPPWDAAPVVQGDEELRAQIEDRLERYWEQGVPAWAVDDFLALPEVRQLLADAAAVQRVRDLAEEWAHHPWGNAVVFVPSTCAGRIRRALDGDPA